MAQATDKNMGSGRLKKPLILQPHDTPPWWRRWSTCFYNIAHRIYIGHIAGIGAAALTGVGLFAPILMLLNAFAMLMGGAARPAPPLLWGRGDRQQAEKIVSNSFTMLLLFFGGADHRLLCRGTGAAAAVRCQRCHPAVRPELQPHLHCRLGVRAGGAGHEPLYHHAGLCQDQYAYHRDRRGDQHYPRPHPDFRVRAGRAGARPLPRCSVRPWARHGSSSFSPAKDHPAPAQRLPAPGKADHSAGAGAGHLFRL